MAVYTNTNENSPLASVEFSPMSKGNFAFFYAKDDVGKDELKQWLGKELGQNVIAEAHVEGQPVLVTMGSKSQQELQSDLEKHGDKLQLHHKSPPFNPWVARGMLSMVGQSLQLSSGLLRQGKIDTATIVFAVSNLAANVTNMMFGAQKSDDINRLRFLKEHSNAILGDHVPEGQLYDTDTKHAELRKDVPPPQTLTQKTRGFVERNSVRFGEVGLRFLGAFGLAFPFVRKNWTKGMEALRSEGVMQAFHEVRNKDKFSFIAGSAYLGGKTIALFSKVPDPYDTKPHTWLDTVREQYLFKLSSLIEGVAAGSLAYNGFVHQGIKIGNKSYRDFLGGTGGLLFTAAFVIRLRAKFGVKSLNTDEIYAHISDTLAKTPPEKIPQLMAESAALLKENLKDKPVDFGQIYTEILTDMYRYHHMALANDKDGKLVMQSANAAHVADSVPLQDMHAHHAERVTQKTGHLSKPASSHVEEAARRAEAQTQMTPSV